jgi:uncharacterized protein with ParB-like and HNH nuclease domain
MNESVDHLQITGLAKPISELFSPVRQFTVEYYQREYAWTTTNVEELLNDLTRSFLASYQSGHPRARVAGYSPYFLGPIVTYTTGGVSFLVDGQQRVTTLTLLLMYLKHISEDESQKTTLSNLVYSTNYGTAQFRMNVEDRAKVMQALLEGSAIKPEPIDSSSNTIWERYQDISRLFPEDLTGEVLPYFVDWVQNRVILVEISTPDKNMALEIFESMNDRGLQLSNMDMLKSYVLSRIEVPEQIERANNIWRDCVNELRDAQKNGDAEFMKTLLRAKYAQTVREAGKGTSPKHFEDIGTAFHKWVREQVEPTARSAETSEGGLNLKSPQDFENFVTRDFQIQSRRYIKLLEVSGRYTSGWEFVFFNAMNDFTLQLTLAMSVSEVDDEDEVFRQKVELVTKFVDLMVARRMANFKRRGYSMMYRPMFALAKSLRGKSLEEIRKILSDRAHNLDESFVALERFSLTNMNKPDVYYLLARMTAWLEEDKTGRYFKGGSVSEPFEVEHVWANKYERHVDEFPSESDFLQFRNRFGALLLLPKSFNASFGALPYAEKVTHYRGQNQLAQSLALGVGPHNPNLRRKSEQLRTPIEAHRDSFNKQDVDERQKLYQEMCEVIWDLSTLGFVQD